MITTFAYDSSGANAHARAVDAVDGLTTVAFWYADGRRRIVYSPFDEASLFDSLVSRVRSLLADSDNGWEEYWQLLARHPWCANEWEKAANCAAFNYRLPNGLVEDVRQAAQAKLYAVLMAKGDIPSWLRKPLQRFERWFRRVVRNLCNAVARKMGGFSRSKEPRVRESPIDHVSQQIADYREKGWPAVLDEMLAVLRRYPERTRDVLLLRSERHSWPEIAVTLGITVDAARWAVGAYQEELRHDFASFR